jgi:hypothetical protein
VADAFSVTSACPAGPSAPARHRPPGPALGRAHRLSWLANKGSWAEAGGSSANTGGPLWCPERQHDQHPPGSATRGEATALWSTLNGWRSTHSQTAPIGLRARCVAWPRRARTAWKRLRMAQRAGVGGRS